MLKYCKTISSNNINYYLVMNPNIIAIASGITSSSESTSGIITNNMVAPSTSESGIVLKFEYNF